MNKGEGYVQGWLDGVRDSGWVCGDCGNTYDALVEACPNHLLDRASLRARAAQGAASEGETQFGYVPEGLYRDGFKVVVGPFPTRDVAELAAEGSPIVELHLTDTMRGAHRPECPNSSGTCCPWMGDCSCQCMCDFIAQVERRIRAEGVGTDRVPDQSEETP